MIGDRVYFQPWDYVIATIHDVKELQKGKGTFDDIPNGIINFTVSMYRIKYEYQFTVTDIGRNRCRVKIAVAGDVMNKEDKILREYALLDSMLAASTQIELMKLERPEPTPPAQHDPPDIKKNFLRRISKPLTLAAACFAVVVIGIMALYHANNLPEIVLQDGQVPLGAPMLPDETVKPYKGEASSIIIPEIGGFTIPADTEKVKMLLPNPEGNACDFTFEIVLTETGETLYTSGLVAPGMCVEDITLSRGLSQGGYGAVVKIQCYAPESGVAISGASVDLYLTVEQEWKR